jgi:transcriptional regulator with XRE-family HTH domain
MVNPKFKSEAMQNKLGEFIRFHRERIKPEELGISAIGRRRTPGLRREELAQLCAVSPTWLTWLEQGRPISASAKVLGKLADVMSLTLSERAYLFRLADKLDPALASEMDQGIACQTFELDAVVDAIQVPAYVLDEQWDAMAWNRPAQELFIGWLDRSESSKTAGRPNLLKFMFLEPKACVLITDWNERANRLVAEFRADCGKYADQKPFSELIEALIAGSEDFKRWWISQHVVGRSGGTRQFSHPVKGCLNFEQVTFTLSIRRGFKLVMLLDGNNCVK